MFLASVLLPKPIKAPATFDVGAKIRAAIRDHPEMLDRLEKEAMEKDRERWRENPVRQEDRIAAAMEIINLARARQAAEQAAKGE